MKEKYPKCIRYSGSGYTLKFKDFNDKAFELLKKNGYDVIFNLEENRFETDISGISDMKKLRENITRITLRNRSYIFLHNNDEYLGIGEVK